ncbi:MAG: hypothetical protein JRI44_14015 [Deltaproteobacteria bacterium]|nr:hypothetical protein [Deltaproteobacteria bacterium]
MTEWLLRIFLGAGAFYLIIKGIYELTWLTDLVEVRRKEKLLSSVPKKNHRVRKEKNAKEENEGKDIREKQNKGIQVKED